MTIIKSHRAGLMLGVAVGVWHTPTMMARAFHELADARKFCGQVLTKIAEMERLSHG